MADFTSHVNIWQEVHLNLYNPVTRAGFATTTLDVKTETPLLVASNLGFVCLGKKVTYIVKNSRIGSWVGPRRSSDRTLVNVNQTINMLNPCNRLEFTRLV